MSFAFVEYDKDVEPEEPFVIKCECGNEWREDEGTPLECPKCGKRQPFEIDEPLTVPLDQIAMELGKYSYCDECEAMTVNMLPMRGYAERAFTCAQCGAEKHRWITGYDCERCGSDSHLPLRYGKPTDNVYAAMEFGGNPLEWEEWHICRKCGDEFSFMNSNY